MSKPEQPLLVPETPQPNWSRPKHRGGCARDPQAGPGTCTYWWEGCPKPEFRRCYQQWFHAQQGGE